MGAPENCNHNKDPLKLEREGTSRDQRFLAALDAANVPIDERDPAYQMVFARALSAFLKYFDSGNIAVDDWQRFFNRDVSVQLAVAAMQQVDEYRIQIKERFDFLNNLDNAGDDAGLANALGELFSAIATLATGLDRLKEGLPADFALKPMLQNLIRTQLAPAFKKLLLYYRDGTDSLLPPPAPFLSNVSSPLLIFGSKETFVSVRGTGLSNDWIYEDNATNWADYVFNLNNLTPYPRTQIYGTGGTLFDHVNYISEHNFFKAIFDQFLKAYSRVTADSRVALETSFTQWDSHEPHYALFLAFLRLLEHARTELNTLTGRHLDYYYREILRLKEKPAQPAKVHLIAELAKHVSSYEIKAGVLLKAGKDDTGKEAFFANDRDFVANRVVVTDLKTIYQHGNERVGTGANSTRQTGRIYASPVSNSDDGMGEALTADDLSWHPYHHKVYEDGALQAIRMPYAEIGFSIASHYLYLAEGTRLITATFNVENYAGPLNSNFKGEILCKLSSVKGWIEKHPATFTFTSAGILKLELTLEGNDPAVTGYLPKTHGYALETTLPVLLILLVQKPDAPFSYNHFRDVRVNSIDLNVNVTGLRTLAVSNDFGPVDTSKPFQPFGAQPQNNSSLVIGSKEVFQKKLTSAEVTMLWQNAPNPFDNSVSVLVNIDYLHHGNWKPSESTATDLTPHQFVLDLNFQGVFLPFYYGSDAFEIAAINNAKSQFILNTTNLDGLVLDMPDTTGNEFYSTRSKHGFIRLRLNNDFGQNAYEYALIAYIKRVTDNNTNNDGIKPEPPKGPVATSITLNYTADQTIILNSSASYNQRAARFFHLLPFGHAEQHPAINSGAKIHLLPQFSFLRDAAMQRSEAEFYIGVSGLEPPQNLALLFQVADGTADPLTQKPDPHIHWSYLSGNQWIPFANNEIDDNTAALLKSGIITFAFPRNASAINTLLLGGNHWIRAAVSNSADAVCRLLGVTAQAFGATFTDKHNDPAFAAKSLEAASISKLDRPDAAVKKIQQPFPAFGGRAAEAPNAFYTRVNERLRHKDRAITLWDYERLVLEAFPQIYRAKCLNHTQYEPTGSGAGIYRELAPGHVTLVTIPKIEGQKLRNPLRPYTSLSVLEDIATYLLERIPCFVKLHVRNPQFEEIRVRFKVRLFDGFDETYYTVQLKEAITRFLSPWAFPGGGLPSFSGKVHKAVLINFVEEQPYVDYVTDFQVFHDINGLPGTDDLSEVVGSLAVSILVSAPAKKHEIQVIHPAEEETPREKCTCEA